MRPDLALAVFLAACNGVDALAVPSFDVALDQLTSRFHSERDNTNTNEDLWKRKGGGGGGSRGGSSSSSGSSGSSGSSSGSSSSGSSGRGSTSSNSGGRTTTGSGVRPAYGAGGAYYGGGARQPYRAGAISPLGIAPFLLAGGALGFWSYAWLAGAYHYPYNHTYPYHNATTNKNETKPVSCLCQPDQECGCDDNGDQTYFNSVIGDGSYNQLNKSLVNVGDVNGTSHIFLNGTLPNGTTADGGDESADGSAAAGLRALVEAAGWWPIVTTAAALAFMA